MDRPATCKDTRALPEKLISPLLRVAFVGCIIALAFLAWLPADAMTRSVLGGHAEHFIAYLGTTMVMGLTLQKRPRLAVQCAVIIAYAAVLEAGQLYSPSRHASLQDFAFSASGVIVGGVLLWMARTRLSSWLRIN